MIFRAKEGEWNRSRSGVRERCPRQSESPYTLHSHQAYVFHQTLLVPLFRSTLLTESLEQGHLLLDLNQSNLDLYVVLSQENKYQEVLEALRNDKVEWNWQGPANKR